MPNQTANVHTVYEVHAVGLGPRQSGKGSTSGGVGVSVCIYLCVCPSELNQITACPPILPQPQNRPSRQQTGTLHLLEK